MRKSAKQIEFARQERYLREKQLQAIELILEGRTDGEVAQEIGVRRQTVNEWRNHNAQFRAVLNHRRNDLVEHRRTKLLQLIDKAQEALEADFTSDTPNARLAYQFLKDTGIINNLGAFRTVDPGHLNLISSPPRWQTESAEELDPGLIPPPE